MLHHAVAANSWVHVAEITQAVRAVAGDVTITVLADDRSWGTWSYSSSITTGWTSGSWVR